MYDTDTTCAGDDIAAGEYFIYHRGIIGTQISKGNNEYSLNTAREKYVDSEYSQKNNIYTVNITMVILCSQGIQLKE